MRKIKDLLTEESISELIINELCKHTDNVPTFDGRWQIREYVDDFFDDNRAIIKEINDRYRVFMRGKSIKTNWSLLQYLKRRFYEFGISICTILMLYLGVYREEELFMSVILLPLSFLLLIIVYILHSERKENEKEWRW